MSDGKIRAEDLVSKEALQVYDELAQKATAALEKITQEVIGLTDAYAKMVTTLGSAEAKEAQAIKNRQKMADLTAETKTKTEALKQATDVYLDSLKRQKADTAAYEAKLRELEKTERERLKTVQLQKRINGEVTGAYKKLSKALVDARNKAKDLAVTDGELSKSFLRAQKEVTKLDAKLKRIDASLGQNQRSVGNYAVAVKGLTSGFRTLASAFGFAGGLFLFVSILKDSFRRVKELDQAIYDLAGTLNVTRFEIADLEEDAIRLGGATKFTAAQIVDLQKQLAKKGFDNSEILDSTEAIINLSVATGEDLSKSAEVASATLRALGLETSEMTRVVNVMASSFTKTALDLTAFTESAKFVTPIARKANISLEELTGLLGVLADNGIKGSIAGTGLRKIISELDKSAKPLNTRIKELSEAYLTLGDATDEVGQRAQTSLLVLTSEIEIADTLKESFEAVGDVAQEMADTKMLSLENRIILLDSAWDRLIQRKSRDNDISFRLGKALDYLTQNIDKIASNVYRAVRAFVIYKAVVIATTTAVTLIQSLIAAGRVLWTAYAIGIRAATTAMLAFKAASAGTILGAIAGGITLIVLAVQYLTEETKKAVVELNKLAELRKKLTVEGKAILDAYKKDYKAGIQELTDDLLLQGKTEEEISLAKIKLTQEYLDRQKEVAAIYREQNKENEGARTLIAALRTEANEIELQIDAGGNFEELNERLILTKKTADDLALSVIPVGANLVTAVKIAKFLGLELVNLKNSVRSPEEITKEEANRLKRLEEARKTAADKKAGFEIDTQIAILKAQAANDKTVLDNKEASYDDQLAAANNYFIALFQIQELQLKKNLIGWKKTAEEREAIEAQNAEKLIAIDNNRKKATGTVEVANITKITKRLEEITAAQTAATNERIAVLIDAYKKEDELDAAAGRSKIARAQKLIQLEEAINRVRLEGDIISQTKEIEFLENIIKNLDPTVKGVQELIDKLKELKAELLAVPTPDPTDLQVWADGAKATLEGVREKFDEYAQYVINSIGLVLENEVIAADNALQANEDKYARLIELAENDENLKQRLEKERARREVILEKKKKKALQKQALFEKAIAIPRAIINTAVGVTGALSTQPAWLGIALAAVVAGLGAVEVAAIASAPIPSFEKGGTMTYDGMAIVGERRHEVVKEPGKAPWITGDKPQLSHLKKGSVIYPSIEKAERSGIINLHRAAMITSVNADARSMNAAQARQDFDFNYYAIERAMTRAVKSTPVRNNTVVNIDLDDFHYRNNIL